ncbi:MAG: [FeFe] hydrogenase H-cluster maturation GTPase HydF [Lentisphaeria bacterium]|jgi:[FeFe] hydrogenase H-cluster maturation GTPase HydF
MKAETTPRGMRLHIGIFGRRNVGKSSLLNALTGQQVAIVSAVAGTTTDPVEKAMELAPVGPVVFIDTAGIDDVGALGAQRIQATRKVLERTELALVIAAAGEWTPFEERLLAELDAAEIPAFVVFNKGDLAQPEPALLARLAPCAAGIATVSARTGAGVEALRWALKAVVPADLGAPPAIVADLLPPGGLAVLVVPIDKEAPKGRLILPQVQVLRDLLDADCLALVVKERELRAALERLARPPNLVVTDSQAFLKVAADTPPAVPMTSFSILFARLKGDLVAQARGAAAIDRLRPGDRILVAEACTHHAIGDDIGRVKIPRWLEQYVGGALQVEVKSGRDFPEDLSPYKLVIHCGACTWNRRQMLHRLRRCDRAGVPLTNYGVAIAHVLGICPRALAPFPAALAAWRAGGGQG